MKPLFDTYLIVDWSAANTPKRGKDSIWIAQARRVNSRLTVKPLANPATRADAMALLTKRIGAELDSGRRVFAGFDFPFGYPAGAAKKIAGDAQWDALWRKLAEDIEDAADNRSNRFTLADHWNRTVFGKAQYWGRPHQHTYDHLPAQKPAHDAFRRIEFRTVETWQPPAKSVWQLAYNGAVGSQAMLGMARLEVLRKMFKGRCAVWPFETKWTGALSKPLTIAEVYPSMFTPKIRPGDVKDAAQVRTVASIFADRDERGAFRDLLRRPDDLTALDSENILHEEGWIVGAGRIKRGTS